MVRSFPFSGLLRLPGDRRALPRMLRALRFSSWVRTSLFRPRLVLPAKARRAVASNVMTSNDYPEIERLFPEAEIQYVPDAGHWVHADQPQQFLAAVCNFLELPPP